MADNVNKDHDDNTDQDRDGQVPVNLNELGRTGLSRFAGEVREDEIRKLRGEKSIDQFKEMRDNDAMVGSLLFVIKNLIRQADWEIVNGEPEDRKFLRQNLNDMEHTWSETLSSILSFLPFGFSVFEMVWKKRDGDSADPSEPDSKFTDGLIGWDKLAPRGQETIEWIHDDSGNLIKVRQDLTGLTHRGSSHSKIELPLNKVLIFRTEMGKNNPTGRSILRSAWRSWYFKKHIEELEGIGVERDLAGLPVAWVPENIANPDTDEEKKLKEQWESMVVNVRNDEQMGMVMPLAYEDGEKRYDFELISSGGDPKIDTSEVIDRYDTRILQSVMADFIMLGTDARGSFALSKSKTELFSLAISTYLDTIEQVMNQKAIPKLFKVNGMSDRELPEMQHGKIKPHSIDEIANFVSKLSASGAQVFPNQSLQDKLLNMAGINVEEDGEQPLDPSDIEPVDTDPSDGGSDSPDETQTNMDKQLRDKVLSSILPDFSSTTPTGSNEE